MPLHRQLLVALLIVFVAVAGTYAVVTPPFEASDELWHYPMVEVVARTGQLPIQDPANPGPWRQEGNQPPLYYLLAAALTTWADTSDMGALRRINPHADIGVVQPDGNANMIVHRPALEAFPWRGTMAAVMTARAFSVVLAAGTVLVTYATARAVVPQWPLLAPLAAALVAFNPMFAFISGSVNNDNLSNLLGNLLVLLLVRLLARDTAPRWPFYVWLGVVTGAGILAKLSVGFLIPLVALALLITTLRTRDWRPLLVGGALSGSTTILIAGWWYGRNWALYRDPTGLNAFLDTVGRRLIPANAAQLWAERHSFLQAYWGFFGGMNVPLPAWAYTLMNTIGALGLLAGVAFLLRVALRRQHPWRWWLAASPTLVWPVVTFVSYLRWTAITPASQGRLVFAALSSIALWMAVGLFWLGRRARGTVPAAAVGALAAITVLAPFTTIAPAYRVPAQADVAVAGAPRALFRAPPGTTDDPAVFALHSATVRTGTVTPQGHVLVDLVWEVITPPAQDWSLYLHLTRPDGVIVGQRDVYPGGGLLATSDLPAGRAWAQTVAVNVPTAAYAPSALAVRVGWYHLPTGARLTHDPAAEGGLHVGDTRLLPRPGHVPNPLSVRFADQVTLIGYELSTLTPRVGEDLTLTLYWQAQRPLRADYVVFAHVIDPRTWTIVAGSDAQPVGWTRPTSTWAAGDTIVDTHTLPVRADAAPGVYELEVGLYTTPPDGTFPRLRVVTDDGGMANDFVYLSRVRVLP